MGKFLREFWIWIAVPFVLVIAAVIYLLVGGSDDAVTPFSYPIY